MKRKPDLFLSHSSRDKDVVRRLAEDLAFLQCDAWLDEWELRTGDSLHDVIGHALERSRFVAVVLGDNYSDSRWAKDELKQVLARERRSDGNILLPLLFGDIAVPPFLEDRVYLDFQKDSYFVGLTRLAALVHGVSRQRTEAAIGATPHRGISSCLSALRYCGLEPYVILEREDWEEIERAGGRVVNDRIRFDPESVAEHPLTSPRVREIMNRLHKEVW